MKKVLIGILIAFTIGAGVYQYQNLGGTNTVVTAKNQFLVDSAYRGPQDTLASSPQWSEAWKNGIKYYKGVDNIWHALPTAIAGLDQILGVGNTTARKINSTGDVAGDSALFRTGAIRNTFIIGDTSTAILNFVFYGNSIDVGSFAIPPTTNGYAYRLTADYGATMVMKAISGTAVKRTTVGDSSLQDRIYTFPTYTPNSYFLFNGGTNDLVTDTINYKIALAAIIDSLVINRGWPASKIVVISPPYSPSRLADSVFVSANNSVCITKGAIGVDVYHPMRSLYVAGNNSIVFSDSLHPSTYGHAVVEQQVVQALPKSLHGAGNLAVYGNGTIAKALSVNGTTTLTGLTSLLTGLYTGALGTGLRIVPAPSLSGGDRVGVKWVGSNLPVNDSFQLAYVYQGGTNSELRLERLGTAAAGTLMSWDQDNDLIIFGDRSNKQTGYRVVFNTVGAYFGAKTNVNSELVVLGNAVTNTQRYGIYRNGNNVAAIGAQSNGTIQIGNGVNGIQMGSISTSDGTTFTSWVNIISNGKTAIGNFTPTAWLHLQAGTAGAGTAPLKFATGTLMTTAEDGAVEYDGSNYYHTVGTTRYPIGKFMKMRTTVSAATTLTLDLTSVVWVFSGSSATVWTLPAVTGNTEVIYRIKNRGSATITLTRAGSDNIYTTATVTTLVINPGEAYEVVNDGTYWLAF